MDNSISYGKMTAYINHIFETFKAYCFPKGQEASLNALALFHAFLILFKYKNIFFVLISKRNIIKKRKTQSRT
jgi:hypothetical protein